MKGTTVFEAYDGKLFYAKETCTMHDSYLEEKYALIKDIKFFYADGSRKEVPPIEEFYTQKTFFSNVEYIIIPKDSCDYLNVLRNVFYTLGEEALISLAPTTFNLYKKDRDYGGYKPIDDEISEIFKKSNFFSTMLGWSSCV